jgi:hypothetical protein
LRTLFTVALNWLETLVLCCEEDQGSASLVTRCGPLNRGPDAVDTGSGRRTDSPFFLFEVSISSIITHELRATGRVRNSLQQELKLDVAFTIESASLATNANPRYPSSSVFDLGAEAPILS